MTVLVAQWLVSAAAIYLLVGLLVAVGFVMRGVNRIDPSAADGSLGFRLLILPGSVALWPLILRRWLSGSPPPEEVNSHRRAARANRTTPQS